MAAQLPLLGRCEPAFDPSFQGIRRITLDDASWVDHLPHWVRGHEALFRDLEGGLEWKHTTQQLYEKLVDTPRLVASLEDGKRRFPLLPELADVLALRYGVHFDRVTFALYRGGSDSVAWHRDRNLRQVREGFVATVSIGHPRRFMLRPHTGGTSRRFSLGWGDLMVMGGACNRLWEHSVPKAARVSGPRIAIMFRHGEIY